MFPNKMASVGLPSIVLIFHPLLIKDFDMKCEGLSRAQGNFAWQIYFQQRADQDAQQAGTDVADQGAITDAFDGGFDD